VTSPRNGTLLAREGGYGAFSTYAGKASLTRTCDEVIVKVSGSLG
jgi:hypothetical protein